jgi:hypothetical protein
MSLSDYQPASTTIEIGKTTLTVRGLSIQDVSSLMSVHLVDLESLVDMYENSNGEGISAIGLGKFVLNIVKDAPALTAHIIALAADEPNMVDKAAKIKFFDQIKLVKEIGRLSFDDVAGLKKFVAELTDLRTAMGPTS